MSHDKLELMSYLKLIDMGYDVFFEVRLSNNRIIDIFATNKNKEKIGVECLNTNLSSGIIELKRKNYKDYFDKMIFCIYEDCEIETNKDEIVWKFPRKTNFDNNINLKEMECISCKFRFMDNGVITECPRCKKTNLKRIFEIASDGNYFSIGPHIFNKKRFIILKKPEYIKIKK